MKKYYFFLFISFIGIALNAQSSFRIKVIDSKTTEGISKALVFIEEIPVPDQETDAFGLVTYQNVPQDRKVRVNVRKKGYLHQQVEIVASVEIKVDNNIVIKLEKESTIPQVTIYGEVTDKNNEEVEGASVEVTILGKPFSDITDPSGNYQIRIDGNTLKSVPSFQIEVKKKGCERVKLTESVLQSEYINKDIKLNCSNQPPPPPPPPPSEQLYEDEYFSIVYKECKKQGSNLQIKLSAIAKDNDQTIYIHGNNNYTPTRYFDNNNSAFLVSSTKIANQNVTGDTNIMRLVQGVPTEITLTFQEIDTDATLVTLLELSIVIENTSETPIAKFRNLKIKQ